MNRTNPIRTLMAVLLLLLLALPLSAQEKEDSVFTFRFFMGSDKFYAPGLNNGEELAKLYDCVDRYKDVILAHKGCVYVNGYCNSEDTPAKNLAIAKTCSNRVKSELITIKGLNEDCFTTRNHTDDGTYVLVRLVVPADDVKEAETPKAEEAPAVAPAPEQTPVVEEEPVEVVTETVVEEVVEPMPAASSSRIHNFAIKTNLLDYAILMPNIEVEWMFKPRWSAALEYQAAWWSKATPRKVYRIATIIPEVRYWVIDKDRWHGMYVGAFVGGGLYDLSNTTKGHEGEGVMAGASIGYMWPISKHFSLDTGLGVGYLRLHDKKYTPYNGHFLYQLTKNINYVGPLRLKLSLVWRL